VPHHLCPLHKSEKRLHLGAAEVELIGPNAHKIHELKRIAWVGPLVPQHQMQSLITHSFCLFRRPDDLNKVKLQGARSWQDPSGVKGKGLAIQASVTPRAIELDAFSSNPMRARLAFGVFLHLLRVLAPHQMQGHIPLSLL
jgi:hypothetical protein